MPGPGGVLSTLGCIVFGSSALRCEETEAQGGAQRPTVKVGPQSGCWVAPCSVPPAWDARGEQPGA